jgi:coatomer subunit beta'
MSYFACFDDRILELWKADLKQTNEKAAESLADPAKYPNLFPDFEIALQVEQMFFNARENFVPSHLYSSAKNDLDLNLIELVKNQMAQQQSVETPVADDDEEVGAEESVPVQAEAEQAVSAPASPVKQTVVSAPASPVPVVNAPVAPAPTPVSEPVEEEEPDEEEVMESVSAASSPVKYSAPVSPAKPAATAAPVSVEEDEDEDLAALLEEEDRLLSAEGIVLYSLRMY